MLQKVPKEILVVCYNRPLHSISINFKHVPLLAEAEENEAIDVNVGAKRFEGRQEKSTAILLAIIVVFVSCHFLRFLVQIYIVFSSPLHGSQKLFEVRFSFCLSLAAFS